MYVKKTWVASMGLNTQLRSSNRLLRTSSHFIVCKKRQYQRRLLQVAEVLAKSRRQRAHDRMKLTKLPLSDTKVVVCYVWKRELSRWSAPYVSFCRLPLHLTCLFETDDSTEPSFYKNNKIKLLRLTRCPCGGPKIGEVHLVNETAEGTENKAK